MTVHTARLTPSHSSRSSACAAVESRPAVSQERLAGGGVAAADDFEAIPEAAQEKAAAGGGAASLF